MKIISAVSFFLAVFMQLDTSKAYYHDKRFNKIGFLMSPFYVPDESSNPLYTIKDFLSEPANQESILR